MKKPLIVFLAVLLAATAGLWADIKYGGYLSLEYIKGQSLSDYARGSIQNIQGGLLASGLVSQKFGFSLEVRARSESLFQIEQAWVGFLPSQAVTIKAGMFLVPFGIWNRSNRPHETPLIRTPLNLEFLYPESWRELGASLEGQVGIFSYAAYVGNGLKEAESLQGGQQFSDNNRDKGRGGRLGLVLGQGIQGGVSYYAGKQDDLDERNLILEGADLSWISGQWEIRGEATKARIKNPEPFAEGKSEGYSIWVVIAFAHFQPVGSFQKVKYNDPFHGDGGISLDRRRWTAGVRYVLTPNVYLKAEYDWNKENPNIKNNQFQLQVAVAF